MREEPWPKLRARRNDEGGQVVTALIVLVFGLILLVTVIGIVPLGQATDEASQASNAADAAALGAAKMIRDALLDELVHPSLRYEDLDRDGLGRGPGCSMGRGGADDYAGRNAARVVSYCYDRRDGRIEVDVQLLDTGVEGSPAKASAAASPGINVALCQRHDDPLPTTTLSPVTTTTLVAPPPTVPARVYPPGTSLRCGAVDLRFSIFSDGRAQLERPGRLPGLLTPRLVR